MAEITIFRAYNFLLSLCKWRIYANGKRMARIGKSCTVSFSLPSGEWELIANCPDFPIPYRKKGLHSNSIKVVLEEGEHYIFDLRPHPLFWLGNHYPGLNHLFTPVECLLLLKQDTNYQDNMGRIELIGTQIREAMKYFTYHPFSLVLVIGFSLFAMVSNTLHPELYATRDGTAWGFMFGLTNLIGLLSGLNKQMLSRGWEHKTLLYASFGALIILLTMPQAYSHWQGSLYFFSILAACYWTYFCFKRWKKSKKDLDRIVRMESAFEKQL